MSPSVISLAPSFVKSWEKKLYLVGQMTEMYQREYGVHHFLNANVSWMLNWEALHYRHVKQIHVKCQSERWEMSLPSQGGLTLYISVIHSSQIRQHVYFNMGVNSSTICDFVSGISYLGVWCNKSCKKGGKSSSGQQKTLMRI